MFTTRKSASGVVAAIVLGALGAGCESMGLDNLPSTGLTETFAGKRAPEPNLEEHPPLVMPPQNAVLPVPGDRPQAAAALNNPQWPKDSDQLRKQAAQAGTDGQCPNGGSDCKSGFLSRLGF